MSITKTITAYIKAGQNGVTVTRPLTQYDYGQILLFDGITLPEAYEVVFSNDDMNGATGKSQIGNSNGVTIPDEFLTTGLTVFAWLFLHEEATDGRTVYKIKIPVRRRAEDVTNPPSEEEITSVTQAIAALNVAVSKSEANVTHYPKIVDGTWRVYDAEAGDFVDTEIRAQGDRGEGAFIIHGTITYDHSDYESTVVTITTTRDEILSNWTETNPPMALILEEITDLGSNPNYLIFECREANLGTKSITFRRTTHNDNNLIHTETVSVFVFSTRVLAEYDRIQYETAHVTVDVVPDEIREIASGNTTFTVTHTSENCNSYLIGLSNTREGNSIYAWIKQSSANSAVIDVLNNGDPVTKRLFNMAWLNVPIPPDNGDVHM